MQDQPIDLQKSAIDKEPEYVTPVFLTKLSDKCRNLAEVGDLIGCSPSTVGTAVRTQKVSKSYELAAELIYSRVCPAPAKRLLVICAPADMVDKIKSGVEFMGGQVSVQLIA